MRRRDLGRYDDVDRGSPRTGRRAAEPAGRGGRAGVFCELGRGEVAFPAVADELGRIGYDGWIVVEQDVLPGMGTPKQSAARNRDYLAELGL